MGHKILKDHANVFCQMFMGSRMAADLSTFGTLPDGQLYIDVLKGTCVHSEAGLVQTSIATELQVWFLERLRIHRIPLEQIRTAQLVVTMKNTLPSKHKMSIMHDWTSDATIETVDRKYSAHLAEPYTWLPMPPTEKRDD